MSDHDDDLFTGLDDKLSEHRASIEILFHQKATRGDRALVREKAAQQRQILIDDGFDLSPSGSGRDLLWRAWVMSSANWQSFIMQDCVTDAEHITSHGMRAQQWGGMILLLTTDPETPDPLETS